MKISKLALIALLGGALMSFGCSDDDGGTAGTGGGAGGAGGTAGSGGGTGGGGGVVACVPAAKMCGNAGIDPTEETCMLDAPPTDDNCVGDESLENPATCTATGTTVTVNVTQLEVGTETVDVDGTDEEWGQCNNGYDLDGCDGNSCIPGMLAPGEGENGVDNALAGLAPVLAGVDGNLGGVNNAFHAGLCDGDIVLAFVIDANTDEGCANVDILSDGAVTDSIILNLSGDGCLSGTVGTIPLNVGGETGSMANAVIRATLSAGGISNGSLGATVDADTAVAIAEALLPGAGAVVGQVLDINDDLSGDASMPCDALSAEMTLGGVTEAPQ